MLECYNGGASFKLNDDERERERAPQNFGTTDDIDGVGPDPGKNESVMPFCDLKEE